MANKIQILFIIIIIIIKNEDCNFTNFSDLRRVLGAFGSIIFQ